MADIVDKNREILEYEDLDDAPGVPVGAAGRGRLRYRSAGPYLELSAEGGPYFPLLTSATGWARWTYLPAGSTDAEIQAALNSANWDAVFLADGTYNIGINLTIPDGKILSAATLQNDQFVVPRVTFVVALARQIRAQKGQLQYCRVRVDGASAVPAITGTQAIVRYVAVLTTGVISNQYALSGVFAEVDHLCVANMGGIQWNGVGSITGTYYKIQNVTVSLSSSTASGFNTASMNYVSIRDYYVTGGQYGFNAGAISNSILENIIVTQTSVYGIYIATIGQSHLYGLYSELSTGTAIYIDAASDCEIFDIQARNCTGSGYGISLANFRRTETRRIRVYGSTTVSGDINILSAVDSHFSDSRSNGRSCSSGTPAAIAFTSSTNSSMTNASIIDMTASTVNNIRGYFFQTNSYCQFQKLHAYNVRGAVGLVCHTLFMTNNIYCKWSDITVASSRSTTGSCTSISGNSHCCLNQVDISNCLSLIAWDMTGWNDGSIANLTSHNNNGVGVNIASCVRTQVSDIHSYINTNGIQFVTANTNLLVGGLHSHENTGSGVVISASVNCQFSDIQAMNNSLIGLSSTQNVDCKFSDIRARNNLTDNVRAGNLDQYCSWTDLHLDTTVAGFYNFNALAATASCYLDGMFERIAGVAGAFNDTFGALPANWTAVNILALP